MYLYYCPLSIETDTTVLPKILVENSQDREEIKDDDIFEKITKDFIKEKDIEYLSEFEKDPILFIRKCLKQTIIKHLGVNIDTIVDDLHNNAHNKSDTRHILKKYLENIIINEETNT